MDIEGDFWCAQTSKEVFCHHISSLVKASVRFQLRMFMGMYFIIAIPFLDPIDIQGGLFCTNLFADIVATCATSSLVEIGFEMSDNMLTTLKEPAFLSWIKRARL